MRPARWKRNGSSLRIMGWGQYMSFLYSLFIPLLLFSGQYIEGNGVGADHTLELPFMWTSLHVCLANPRCLQYTTSTPYFSRWIKGRLFPSSPTHRTSRRPLTYHPVSQYGIQKYTQQTPLTSHTLRYLIFAWLHMIPLSNG